MKIVRATLWILAQVLILCGCGENGKTKLEGRDSPEVVSTSSFSNEVVMAVAEINGTEYLSLSAAITAVPNNTETTIKLLANITGGYTIPNNKNIVLNEIISSLSNILGIEIESKRQK